MSEVHPAAEVQYATTACPLCGDGRSTPLMTAGDLLYGFAGEFTLVRCGACEHVFLNPRPTRECIGSFYPSDYGPFRSDDDGRTTGETSHLPRPRIGGEGRGEGASVIDGESIAPLPLSLTLSPDAGAREPDRGARRLADRRDRSFAWRWLKRLVLWWIESRATLIPDVASTPKRALELGCSHGAFLEQLRQRGWECVGVEPAKDVAQRAAAKGFDVRVGSLEEVFCADRDSSAIEESGNESSSGAKPSPQPALRESGSLSSPTFAVDQFDVVFAWMVVEHLHDPVSTLRLARQLLKPGGWLLFSVPNFGCWERSAFGRFWYALQLPTHLQHYTQTSLRQLLNTAGFESVELIHQRNVNNLVGTLGLWLRTKFPRWSLGERLIRWTDNPTALSLCLLAPLARTLAGMWQAGRLTVVARRP